MVDLARFERVFAEVYHGQGTETGAVLSTADLPVDTDPVWPTLTLRPAPCLRLVTIRYTVHGYAAAIARGATPELPRAQMAVLAVHRRAYTVVITELTPPADRLLAALLSGETVAAAATTAGSSPTPVQPWIRGWVEAGLFTACALRPNPKTSARNGSLSQPLPRTCLNPYTDRRAR